MTRHRKAWYEENKNKPGYKEKLYESRIKFKYGIGVGVVNEMLYNQSNRCAICEKEFVSKKTTHIDHCHSTGKIRGMLCEGCNIGLGGFKDNVDILKKAIEYLLVSAKPTLFISHERKSDSNTV